MRRDVTRHRYYLTSISRLDHVNVYVERWAQVQEGIGHVVVLSGEPGIGKSRLVEVLKARAAAAPPYAPRVPLLSLS